MVQHRQAKKPVQHRLAKKPVQHRQAKKPGYLTTRARLDPHQRGACGGLGLGQRPPGAQAEAARQLQACDGRQAARRADGHRVSRPCGLEAQPRAHLHMARLTQSAQKAPVSARAFTLDFCSSQRRQCDIASTQIWHFRHRHVAPQTQCLHRQPRQSGWQLSGALARMSHAAACQMWPYVSTMYLLLQPKLPLLDEPVSPTRISQSSKSVHPSWTLTRQHIMARLRQGPFPHQAKVAASSSASGCLRATLKHCAGIHKTSICLNIYEHIERERADVSYGSQESVTQQAAHHFRVDLHDVCRDLRLGLCRQAPLL